MRRQNKLIQNNKARKAKSDLIAEKLDENNIIYKIKVGINNIFQIKNIEIIVSADNIIINNNEQQTDLNDEIFWKELDRILADPTLKKENM